jgi:hypothetical protein
MPSPFPGMNPYLENSDVWQDFHDSMIPAIRDALVSLVRSDFVVKIEQHLFIHEPAAENRLFFGKSDVGVAHPKGEPETGAGTALLPSPAMATLPSIEFEKCLFLEIRDRKDRDLVTVLEMLSPSNKKPGADREQYLAKRGRLLHGSANLVEIDLLRGWPRMPIVEPKICDYRIIVSRVIDRPKVNDWPLLLRDSLPTIPIPLRPPFAPVELALQPILHEVYDRAGYKNYIYENTPEPPLSAEDAAWRRH